MHPHIAPDTLTKLDQMGDATAFEPAGDAPAGERGAQIRRPGRPLSDCVMSVATPGGPKPILKTMLTTACERNCFYCPFRAGRGKTRRVTITPDALAAAFDALQRA